MKQFHVFDRFYWNCFNFEFGPNETVSLSRSVLMKQFQFSFWSYWNCLTSSELMKPHHPFISRYVHFQSNLIGSYDSFLLRIFLANQIWLKVDQTQNWNSFNRTDQKHETVSSIPIDKNETVPSVPPDHFQNCYNPSSPISAATTWWRSRAKWAKTWKWL